jgi:tetratricopeptide (TPR) repeat protein
LRYTAKAEILKTNLWGCVGAKPLPSLLLALLCVTTPGYAADPKDPQVDKGEPEAQIVSEADRHAADVKAAREKVQANPQDARARFELGRALRLSGKTEQAASEYLEATTLDPSLYLAYHELSLMKCRPEQTEEAIDRLNGLKETKPKDLMLRVALSELLEKKGQTYPAARVLVDLVYQNAVPPKYLNKVNTRIHFLLSKTKDTQTAQKVQSEDEDMDGAPPPLPETTLHRNLAASTKAKDKSVPGFGHTTLLP